MSDTWGSLHAGDVVLGGDEQEWGVELARPLAATKGLPAQIVIRLIRHGVQATAMLPATSPVVVVLRADTSEEHRAVEALLGAGLTPEVIEERWES